MTGPSLWMLQRWGHHPTNNNEHIVLGHYQPASEMPFVWHLASRLIVAHLYMLTACTLITFVAFSWAVTSTGPGKFMVCVYILWREHLKTQPKVVFERPGIEPTTPDLLGIALVHYTTVACTLITGTLTELWTRAYQPETIYCFFHKSCQPIINYKQ